MINLPDEPKINYKAALYLLEGHYLLRYPKDGSLVSKFIRASDVSAAFSQREADSGWFPSGVIRAGENVKGPWYVYSVPARKIGLEIFDDQIKLLVPYPVDIPCTVLIGTGSQHYLFALNIDEFSPSSEAFRAPFPNVNSGTGKICWGQNGRIDSVPAMAIKTWNLFFESPFNRDLSEKCCKSHPNDVRVLLRELSIKKARNFPKNELVSTGKTIGEWVDTCIWEEE
jgi:hypothetical protein